MMLSSDGDHLDMKEWDSGIVSSPVHTDGCRQNRKACGRSGLFITRFKVNKAARFHCNIKQMREGGVIHQQSR